MKKRGFISKTFIIGAIIFLLLPSVQIVIANTQTLELFTVKDDLVAEPLDTDHYQNCYVVVTGHCNSITGPLSWLFGVYVPLRKRNFGIQATGEEGESVSIIVFGNGFGTYYDLENINIEIAQANGFLFWGNKSILVEGNRIFTFCKVQDVWITI